MWKFIIIPAVLVLFAAVSYWNYRRFMPAPKAFKTPAEKVNVKPLTIRSDAHTLYGELLLPAGKTGKLPTVICCHGFGSSYKLCRDTMGKCFAMSGYAVVCFDFYGGSKHSKSGGTMLEMSIFTEREDLSKVIEAVKAMDTTDTDNLFLLGESQGGCVAGITAPRFQNDLKAIVEYYPAYCIPDDARKKYKSVDEIPAVCKTFGLDVGKVYNEKLLDFDVYEEIKGYMGPVLILHGDRDTVVPIEYGRRAAETYTNAEIVTFSGEIHGFTGKGKLRAAKLSYEFFNKHLTKK